MSNLLSCVLVFKEISLSFDPCFLISSHLTSTVASVMLRSHEQGMCSWKWPVFHLGQNFSNWYVFFGILEFSMRNYN